MLDPVKTAFAAVGTAFAAGVAWMTLKGQVARVRGDLNRMGAERVKKVEDRMTDLSARLDEQRDHGSQWREQSLERETRLRERITALETTIGFVQSQLATHLAREV